MTQAKTANTVKKLLQSRQITPAMAFGVLREQTEFSNTQIVAMVREWSKKQNLDLTPES